MEGTGLRIAVARELNPRRIRRAQVFGEDRTSVLNAPANCECVELILE